MPRHGLPQPIQELPAIAVFTRVTRIEADAERGIPWRLGRNEWSCCANDVMIVVRKTARRRGRKHEAGMQVATTLY
jgi:hypothetical protein